MTFIIVIFAVVFLSLALILSSLWRGRPIALRDWRDLPQYSVPVDLEAFQRLMHPGDEEFVRNHLSPAAFRKAQRLRARAAFDYLGRVRRNAALLMGIGEDARYAPDPVVAEAGERLVHTAIAVRINSTRMMLRLGLMWLFPNRSAAAGRVPELYENLRWNIQRLTNLREPRLTSRIGSAV
jgi:hypothetical protein